MFKAEKELGQRRQNREGEKITTESNGLVLFKVVDNLNSVCFRINSIPIVSSLACLTLY